MTFLFWKRDGYYQAEIKAGNSNIGKNFFSRKTAEFVCRLAAQRCPWEAVCGKGYSDVLRKLFVARDVQMFLE